MVDKSFFIGVFFFLSEFFFVGEFFVLGEFIIVVVGEFVLSNGKGFSVGRCSTVVVKDSTVDGSMETGDECTVCRCTVVGSKEVAAVVGRFNDEWATVLVASRYSYWVGGLSPSKCIRNDKTMGLCLVEVIPTPTVDKIPSVRKSAASSNGTTTPFSGVPTAISSISCMFSMIFVGERAG